MSEIKSVKTHDTQTHRGRERADLPSVFIVYNTNKILLGIIVQLVVHQTVDLGIWSLNPSFVENDHDIFSSLIQEGQLSVSGENECT